MSFFPLLAALALTGPAAAAQPQTTSASALLSVAETTQSVYNSETAPAGPRRGPAPQTRRDIPGPSEIPEPIIQMPEGDHQFMVKKGGVSQWYHPLAGELQNWDDGMIMETVTTDDGMFYMKPVWSLAWNNCWIKGRIEDGEVVMQFPQIADRRVYDDGLVVDQACLAIGYTPSPDDPNQGYYEPTEEQVYRFTILEDGTLKAVDENMVLGYCYYFETDEAGNPIEPYWSWQYTCSTFTTMEPDHNKVAEIPAGVEIEQWNKIDQYSAFPYQVAIDGDQLYIVGIMAGTDLATSPIVGTISPDRKTVSFKKQFLGHYMTYMCQAWFMPCDKECLNMEEVVVFDFDEERKTLNMTGAFGISIRDDGLACLSNVTSLYLCAPDPDMVVTSLPTPIVEQYLPMDPQTGLLPELDFILPAVQDGNVLPTGKLYYNLIIDDEVFEFLPDEYNIEEPMTEIPYTFSCWEMNSLGGGRFYIIVYPEGFDSIGVRMLYKDGDTTVFSEIGWAPGYEGAGASVDEVEDSEAPVSVEYYNAAGMRIPASAAKGICIRRATYGNGEVITEKMVR